MQRLCQRDPSCRAMVQGSLAAKDGGRVLISCLTERKGRWSVIPVIKASAQEGLVRKTLPVSVASKLVCVWMRNWVWRDKLDAHVLNSKI